MMLRPAAARWDDEMDRLVNDKLPAVLLYGQPVKPLQQVFGAPPAGSLTALEALC